MDVNIVCWKCGAALPGVLLPMARREECPHCTADLHVCRMCEFYDTSYAKSCREPVADEVRDKERANFCGYFKPLPDAFQQRDGSEADEAKAKLAALFGDAQPEGGSGGTDSEAEAAKKKLEKLFGVDGDEKT